MAFTNWTNVTDLAQVPAMANAHGGFWAGILYMIWVVMIVVMIGYGFEIALMVSSFICLILGLLLVYGGGLIAWWHCMVFVGVLLFMFLYVMYVNDSQSKGY